jgi:hypothetical protein
VCGGSEDLFWNNNKFVGFHCKCTYSTGVKLYSLVWNFARLENLEIAQTKITRF